VTAQGALFRPADSVELRRAFACFPSGVVGLCALADGGPAGIAASSFTSVSLEPALVSVCVAHTSTTWPALRVAGRLGISVLSEAGEAACLSLSAKGTDRFAALSWTAHDDGAVFLDNAVLRLNCSIEQEVAAGDHDIVVLRVHELSYHADGRPLVFHGSRFRQLTGA